MKFKQRGPVARAAKPQARKGVRATVSRELWKSDAGKYYFCVELDAPAYFVEMDAMVRRQFPEVTGSPLRGSSLLVKAPHAFDAFRCRFQDAEGRPCVSADVLGTVGVRVLLDLEFGGVWKDGYSWKLCLAKRAI